MRGRQPDGDSIRFIPHHPDVLRAMPHASRLRFAKDGSVQLRMDGIDAPETHFAGQSQPYGDVAREAFLQLCGFENVTYDRSGTVVGSEPHTIEATILVNTLDPYGRPVSYLLPGTSSLADGQLHAVTAAVLARTVNVAMLEAGAAYITLYNSAPPAHRATLRAAALSARKAQKGVWAVDTTNRFTLTDLQSIGPSSNTLILPKLFRRAVHYLQAVEAGYTGTFPRWIEGTTAHVYHSEDDSVIRPNGVIQPLHQIIKASGDRITNDLDPINDVFIEQ